MTALFRKKGAQDTPADPPGPAEPAGPAEPGGPAEADAPAEPEPLDLRLDEHHDTPALHLTPDLITQWHAELAEMERDLGPGHEDVLLTRNNYAMLLGSWAAAAPPGDTRMADRVLALLEVNLGYQEASLGPDHRATLSTCQSIGHTHLTAGRPELAIPYLERVLEGRKHDEARDDEATLTAREKLSDACAAAGMTDRAIALLEETVAVSERLLPPGAETVRNRKAKLFDAHRDAGRRAEAIALCQEIIRDSERFYGAHHLDTYVWIDNLAHLHHDEQDLEAAIACYERAIAGLEQIHGPDSEAISYRYHNLAIAHLDGGHPDRAIPHLEEALAACEHSFGADHGRTLDALVYLVNVLDRAGRIAEAVEATERLVAALLRVGGPDHPGLPEVRGHLEELKRSLR
ncbi:tetratricopeptide repeat protein [Streptomyces sp. NBC_01268]|uniref:tetratricopeptide repeat protein n=1 Tax=Streptomyces sp. NBC_01268 TaxID=2903806 RepID=UPI002E34EA7B|nr:tetratricopeptide repeat protein [Streptomyces sp. NBC_01268]